MSTDIRSVRWRIGMVTPRDGKFRGSYWDATTNIDYFLPELYERAALCKLAMRSHVAMLNKGKNLNDYIVIASNISNMDDAVLTVQREIGVESGDYASLFFSGMEHADWVNLNGAARYELLKCYIISEINVAAIEDSDVFEGGS